MQIANACHLSYCTNIHPGEDWPTLFANLKQHLPLIKQQVCPEQAMGLGLRLSAEAASMLCAQAQALQSFQQWLNLQQLYVYTLNGFPYGVFHGEAVKEAVYLPDWSSEARYSYSCELATLLCKLLPSGLHGSISTVPVGFKANFDSSEKLTGAVQNLLRYVGFLIRLKNQTGVTVQLALEPEPGCFLETTAGAIEFFTNHLFTEQALQTITGFEPGLEIHSVDEIRQHLGVCLDTCHAAVMFESSKTAAEQFIVAGIPIHKIQLTAALQVSSFNSAAKSQLAPFAEGVYLHQSCVRHNSRCEFFLDLQPALDAVPMGAELRSHFHVPVFYDSLDALATTQSDLIELLQAQQEQLFSPHLEVETYTFDVLPAALRKNTVADNISRELNWVKEKLR